MISTVIISFHPDKGRQRETRYILPHFPSDKFISRPHCTIMPTSKSLDMLQFIVCLPSHWKYRQYNESNICVELLFIALLQQPTDSVWSITTLTSSMIQTMSLYSLYVINLQREKKTIFFSVMLWISFLFLPW